VRSTHCLNYTFVYMKNKICHRTHKKTDRLEKEHRKILNTRVVIGKQDTPGMITNPTMSNAN